MTGDVSQYGSHTARVFVDALDPWGNNGQIERYSMNNEKWNWMIRGYNNDKQFKYLAVMQVEIKDTNGSLKHNYINNNDGTFSDSNLKGSKFWLTTGDFGLKVMHFVPVK